MIRVFREAIIGCFNVETTSLGRIYEKKGYRSGSSLQNLLGMRYYIAKIRGSRSKEWKFQKALSLKHSAKYVVLRMQTEKVLCETRRRTSTKLTAPVALSSEKIIRALLSVNPLVTKYPCLIFRQKLS